MTSRTRHAHSLVRCLAFIGAVLLQPLSPALALTTTLVPTGSTWKYLDNGSNQGSLWHTAGFADVTWSSGAAQLGYGDSDEATMVGYGPDANAKFITTYFRKLFSVSNAASFLRADLRLLRDDGAVVYLNGIEIFRSNMPAGALTSTTLASSVLGTPQEAEFVSASINPALLINGTNLLAVEIHQGGPTSSDISFDLELTGSDTLVSMTRAPYLQSGTPSSMVVRWRTDTSTDSRVRFGTSLADLNLTADVAGASTEHIVSLGGLTPDTKYYYAVGTSTVDLTAADSTSFFVTAPNPGTPKATRVWVLGDAGTATANQLAVRDAYDAFTGPRATDLWLMLGDNAYNSGTDSEYQTAVFDIYPGHLRNAVLWPTLGNHDGVSADSATQTGPYYDMFTLPTLGQAGGVASGTEAYYSFDYANIHFVCLDSQESDRSPGGAMLTWLNDDLLATNAEWIVAFFHHPPYSKGSHDSDIDIELTEMRQNALPILEAHGVDLVLSGHSHSYERSVLLDGHYGLSTTLTSSMIVDGGDGRLTGNGPYTKAAMGITPHAGAVYAVAGSSGQIAAAPLNHPAMYVSLLTLGSMVLDVNHNLLQATFLSSTGSVDDNFTIEKGGPLCGNGLKEVSEACDQGDLGGATCSTPGCTISCTSACELDSSGPMGPIHDTVILPVRPQRVRIPAGAATVTKTIMVKVRNADVLPTHELPGHVVRLTATPGDCPGMTIQGAPDFDIHTANDQDTALLKGGQTRKARIRLNVLATDHNTPNLRAPRRCTLMLTAVTDIPVHEDPTPRNNVTPVEINVIDASDPQAAMTHDSVIRSVRPLRLTIRDGAVSAGKTVGIKLINADPAAAAESAGHPIALGVSPAGDCPAGVVSVVAPGQRVVATASAAMVQVRVNATPASFAANKQSPDRCTAVLTATTNVSGNTEPYPSNNATRLVIDVDDRTDY